MWLILLTSHMIINFSFKLIKMSFTKCFLNDYKQFIKTRYMVLNDYKQFIKTRYME